MDAFPFDLKDLILCSIPSQKDLLSLAFASRSWYSLIVPRHSEYRELRLSSVRPEIWAHLSHRPDLASNIRNVCISEHTAIREAYPKTLVDVDQVCETGDLTRALANMTSLHKFQWASPWYPRIIPEDEQTAVFQVLRESRTLKELAIYYEVYSGDRHSTVIGSKTLELASQSPNFPLWHISDLTSLKLFGAWETAESIPPIVPLFKLCTHLQELSITFDESTYGFTSCTFPHLRKLHVQREFYLFLLDGIPNSVVEAAVLSFLVAHPTIEELRCDILSIDCNQLPPRLLPNLKRLETNDSTLTALLYDNAITARPLEAISKIILDKETFNLLKNLNPDTVCEFGIWCCEDWNLLARIGELFPKIIHLEINRLATEYSGIIALRHFTAVESIYDNALSEIMKYEEDEIKQSFFDSLARTCPSLKRCYYDDGKGMMCVSLIKPSGSGRVRLELSRRHFE